MKVLLLNGSPREKGCTYTALCEIQDTFKQENIESEIFYIGCDPISPCRACGACNKLKKCAINDKVNKFLELAQNIDGLIVGSPVHYASASSIIVPFLDRAFYAGSRMDKKPFKHKPAAAIVSARRAGTTATLDQLYKYFSISQMPIISGRYWNMVHGSNADEVRQDKEGMQNMRILAKNFSWHLKCIQMGLSMGITPPVDEEVIYTNFIR